MHENTFLNHQRQHTPKAYLQTQLSNDRLSQIKTWLLTGRVPQWLVQIYIQYLQLHWNKYSTNSLEVVTDCQLKTQRGWEDRLISLFNDFCTNALKWVSVGILERHWITVCAYVKGTWCTAGQSFPYAWEKLQQVQPVKNRKHTVHAFSAKKKSCVNGLKRKKSCCWTLLKACLVPVLRVPVLPSQQTSPGPLVMS